MSPENLDKKELDVNKSQQQIAAFAFGVIFIIVLLILAIKFPNPTPFQYLVFRIVLALAAAGVAAMIPGFLRVDVSNVVRAGGALGVFVVVFFFNPAKLTGVVPKTEEQIEIDKPVVLRDEDHGRWRVMTTATAAPASPATEILVVAHSDDLLKPGVLAKRYARITIQSVVVQMPSGSTLVANEIEGTNGAALVGNDFSVLARRLANLRIDVSGRADPPTSAGSIWIYAKVLENDALVATGAPGKAGTDGANGHAGADGGNGGSASCEGFGGYHGAHPGQDGGNGGDGEDGKVGGDGMPGGEIIVTTIKEPVSTTHSVEGGAGGAGGRGGSAGAGGRGGIGGRGCMGFGGHAADEANGRPGLAGTLGHNAGAGKDGTPGHYELKIVHDFDRILDVLHRVPNDQLQAALKTP
jgi:hypothetical protein